MSVCRVGSAEAESELRRRRRRWRSFAMMLMISGSLVTCSKYLNWSVIVSSCEVFLACLSRYWRLYFFFQRLLGLFAIYPARKRKQKHVLDVSSVHEHLVHRSWHVLPWI